MSDGDGPGNDPTTTPTNGPGAVLTNLVGGAIGVDLAAVDGAVTLTERGDDPTPAMRVLDHVAGGGSLVGVVPRIEPSLARGFTERTGGEARVVLTGRAAERLTGVSGAAVESVLANHGVEVSVHEGDSPIGVLLVGERALVGLFDGDGLVAVLSSDSPLIREWVTTTYRRYADAADPL